MSGTKFWGFSKTMPFTNVPIPSPPFDESPSDRFPIDAFAQLATYLRRASTSPRTVHLDAAAAAADAYPHHTQVSATPPASSHTSPTCKPLMTTYSFNPETNSNDEASDMFSLNKLYSMDHQHHQGDGVAPEMHAMPEALSPHMQVHEFMPLDYTVQQRGGSNHSSFSHHEPTPPLGHHHYPHHASMPDLGSGAGDPSLAPSLGDLMPSGMPYVPDYPMDPAAAAGVTSNTPRYMFSLDDMNSLDGQNHVEDHKPELFDTRQGHSASASASPAPAMIKTEQDHTAPNRLQTKTEVTSTSVSSRPSRPRKITTRSGRQSSTSATASSSSATPPANGPPNTSFKPAIESAEPAESTETAAPATAAAAAAAAAATAAPAPPKRKRLARRRLTKNQKIAHNKIEKKYRTNINDKIFGLQDLIAASWVSGGEGDGESSDEREDDDQDEDRTAAGGGGGAAAGSGSGSGTARPNKSSILERAAGYIRHLQETNQRLRKQNSVLKTQLADRH